MFHTQKEVGLAGSVTMSCFRKFLAEVVVNYVEKEHCSIACQQDVGNALLSK